MKRDSNLSDMRSHANRRRYLMNEYLECNHISPTLSHGGPWLTRAMHGTWLVSIGTWLVSMPLEKNVTRAWHPSMEMLGCAILGCASTF